MPHVLLVVEVMGGLKSFGRVGMVAWGALGMLLGLCLHQLVWVIPLLCIMPPLYL